jgi:hypothetical protein
MVWWRWHVASHGGLRAAAPCVGQVEEPTDDCHAKRQQRNRATARRHHHEKKAVIAHHQRY